MNGGETAIVDITCTEPSSTHYGLKSVKGWITSVQSPYKDVIDPETLSVGGHQAETDIFRS